MDTRKDRVRGWVADYLGWLLVGVTVLAVIGKAAGVDTALLACLAAAVMVPAVWLANY